MFTVRDIVGIAIKVEQNGERAYRTAAAGVTDPSLSALLTQLADDEARHSRWFSRLSEGVVAGDTDDELASMGQSMLSGVVGEQSFSLDDVDLTKLSDTRGVLEAAVELELDTVIFYQMLAGFVSDEATLQHLQAVIDEEKLHGQRLQDYLDTGRDPGTDGQK